MREPLDVRLQREVVVRAAGHVAPVRGRQRAPRGLFEVHHLQCIFRAHQHRRFVRHGQLLRPGANRRREHGAGGEELKEFAAVAIHDAEATRKSQIPKPKSKPNTSHRFIGTWSLGLGIWIMGECPHDEVFVGGGRLPSRTERRLACSATPGRRCERGAQDSRARSRCAARALQARPNAVQRERPQRPRAADGGSARDRAARAREHVLAAERPGGLALYKALEKVDTPARAQYAALPARSTAAASTWSTRTEPFVGSDADAARPRPLPGGPHARRVEAYVTAHPEQQGGDLTIRTRSSAASREPLDRPTPYHVEYAAVPRAAAARRFGKAAAAVGRSGVREVPPPARRRAAHRRLLRERHRLGRSAEPEVRHHLRALRDLPRRSARREDVLRRGGPRFATKPRASKLAVFQKYVPDIQDALPLAPADRPSESGHVTPMEVMDAPFRAGDLRHGYQAVADNLPNDPRIHEQKGTKKIFFKNFMDARVNYVILPLAKRMMDPTQAKRASAEGYLADGGDARDLSRPRAGLRAQRRQQVDIREAIGRSFSGLEEAKADVIGMFGLKWLVDKGVLPKERLEEYYASYARRHLPHRPLRHRRGAWPGRDDGVQLPTASRARSSQGERPLPRRLREDCRRDRAAGEGAARAGSDRRPRARRGVVQQVRQDAGGSEGRARWRRRTCRSTSTRFSFPETVESGIVEEGRIASERHDAVASRSRQWQSLRGHQL